MHKRLRGAYVVLSVLSTGVITAGCPDTKPDPNDTSPPNLEWRMSVEGEEAERVYGQVATATVPPGKRARVWLRVVDPGGVKEIRTRSDAGSFSCRQGDLGQNGVFDFGGPERVLTGQQDENGNVPSTLATLPPYEYTFPAESPCQPGWTLVSYAFQLTGEGTNWAGLKTTGASLTVSRQ